MPAARYLPEVLETTETERLATGLIFTEGPLWIRRVIGISSIFARTSFLSDARETARTRHHRRKRHDL